MNNIVLTGRLTKDVQTNQARDTMVAKFNLAVYRDKENTDFIPCVAFGKNAEVLTKYTGKGSQIGVEGRLQSGKYTNKEGKTIYTLDVIVNRVELLGNKAQEQPTQTNVQDDVFNAFGNVEASDIDFDDLPF